ncbi:MAG: hypothetical protein V1706_12995 [Pseudomonadota bacterium]
MEITKIGNEEEVVLLALKEDHFNDIKSKRIAPAKLQETFVAFANLFCFSWKWRIARVQLAS